jgi:transposase
MRDHMRAELTIAALTMAIQRQKPPLGLTQNAAHAAFAGQRTVTRIALQMIHNTIVCAPDGLRDQLRNLTRMQLVRTLASWRPDLTAYRDLDAAYRIGLKSLARRYLELHDEIGDLDAMIAAIVDELAPNLVARNSIGHIVAAQLLLTAGDNPDRRLPQGPRCSRDDPIDEP